VLGNEADNPTQLTAHDWLTDANPPWHQSSIRKGQKGVGHWAVRVEEAGTFEIALRRWPREVSKAIDSNLKPGKAVPGLVAYRETPGKGFAATSATLSIAGFSEEKPVKQGAESVTFTVDLKPGDFDLHGAFIMGEETISAYYAVVKRL